MEHANLFEKLFPAKNEEKTSLPRLLHNLSRDSKNYAENQKSHTKIF